MPRAARILSQALVNRFTTWFAHLRTSKRGRRQTMRIRGLIALTAVFGALLVPATAHAAVYDVHIFTVTLDSSGGLLIRGNLAGCPNGWTYRISGTVTQRQAGGTVTGDFSTSGTCTPRLDRWRAFAAPSSGGDFN